MSHTATRPWWADVQHLRPEDEGGSHRRATRTGRFDRPTPSRRGGHAEGERPAPRAAHTPGERPAPRAAHTPDERPAPPRARREPEDWLEPDVPAAPKKERRTIEIRGQVDRVHGVAPIDSPGPQRVRGRMPHERVGPRPDRIALYAVLLGLLLILVAAISSPGADAAVLAGAL